MRASQAAVGLVMIFLLACGASRNQVCAEEPELGSKTFNEALESIRTKHNVPALTAAAYIEGKVVEIGAAGVRKAGSAEKVSIDDLW
ncbi:MAG: hypothetical protein EOP84_37040, partial [Verrucomicrobiaceae bacterium]